MELALKIVKVFWGKSRGKVGKLVQMFGGSCMVKAKILLNCVAFWGEGMGKRLGKCVVEWKVRTLRR